MLKRDFILVQIEELAKAIAQLIDYRTQGETKNTVQLLNMIYTSLQVDKHNLLAYSPEELRIALNGDDGDSAGLQRLEIAAKALIEESYFAADARIELLKAKEILIYLQKHDNTFSLERVILLEEIQARLI